MFILTIICTHSIWLVSTFLSRTSISHALMDTTLNKKCRYLVFCSIFFTLDLRTAKEWSNLLRKSCSVARFVSSALFWAVSMESVCSLSLIWLFDLDLFPALVDGDLEVLSDSIISESLGISLAFSLVIGINRCSRRNKLSFVHNLFSLLIFSTWKILIEKN